MTQFAKTRVIVLSGEEFQRGERLKEILGAAVDPATRDFNLDIIWPDDFSPEKLADVIMTFPLMAERRVVVLRNFDTIHPETRKKASAVIADTPETTLVVVEGEKAALAPKPKNGLMAEFFKPVYESQDQLSGWIKGRFRMCGKTISEDAVALMINNLGNDLSDIASEIEKVITITPGRAAVTGDDVRAVVGEFRRDTVYEFCNAVGLGEFGKASGILENLMESEKNRETFYTAKLFEHILKLAAYNSQVRAGVPPEEAAKAITSSPFLWKLNRYVEQARNLTPEAARKSLREIGRAESLLKKSVMDKRLVVELMLPRVVPERKRSRG